MEIEYVTCAKHGRYEKLTKRGKRKSCHGCQKDYRLANKDRLNEYARKWRKDNPERVKQLNKDYRSANLEYLKAKNKEWSSKNKDYIKSYRKQYRKTSKSVRERWDKSNPDSIKKSQRKIRLRDRYGMTTEEYDSMVNAQNNLCAICYGPEVVLSKTTGKPYSLSVDHCHKTGRIRGLLCKACNLMLGYARDSSEILVSASDYLSLSR